MFRIPSQSIFTCHSEILSSCNFLLRRSVQIFFLSVFLSVNLQFPLYINLFFSHFSSYVSCIPYTVIPLSFCVTCYFMVSKILEFFSCLHVRISSVSTYTSIYESSRVTHKRSEAWLLYLYSADTAEAYTPYTGRKYFWYCLPSRTIRGNVTIWRQNIYIFFNRTSIWLPALHGELSSSWKCSVRIGMSFAVKRTGSSLAIIMSVVNRICCSVQLPAMCDVKKSWHNIKSYKRWRKIYLQLDV